MIHVKAYQIDPATTTKIVGNTTAANVPLLNVSSMSAIKKSLEGDIPAVFNLSSVSLTLESLTETHFSGHNKAGGAPSDNPFVFEIQYGTSWDHADSRVVFYGVLDGQSVHYDNKTRKTTLAVMSWDSLFKNHQDVSPRTIYRTKMMSDFLSNDLPPRHTKDRLAEQANDFYLLDALFLNDFIQVGSVVVANGNYNESNFQYRLPVLKVNSSTGTIGQIGVRTSLEPRTGLTRGPYTDWYIQRAPFLRGVTIVATRGLIRNKICVPARHFGALPDTGGASILWIENSTVRSGFYEGYRVVSSKRVAFNPAEDNWWIASSETEYIECTLDRFLPNTVSEGDSLKIQEAVHVQNGSDVEVWGSAVYGVGEGDTEDFDVEDLVLGLSNQISVFSTLVNQSVSVSGTPIKISRFTSPSSRPDEALSQLQRSSECYIEFEPLQGATGRIGAGARKVQISIATRESLVTGSSALPTPIEFSGESIGTKPRYVSVTAPLINDIQVESGTIGWFPDSLSFTDLSTTVAGSNSASIEMELIVPAGDGVFTTIGQARHLNDARLSGLARRYFEFHSVYYKKQDVTVDGLYDFVSTPGTGAYDTFLGKIVNDAVTGKTGFVREIELDYKAHQTKMSLMVADGSYAAYSDSPVAVLSTPSIVSDAGTFKEIVVTAVNSYDPAGQPLTFSWYKNNVLIAGQTAPGLITSDVVHGDIIKVRVTDPDTNYDEASVDVALDSSTGITVDTDISIAWEFGTGSTDTVEDVKVLAHKSGSSLYVEYMEAINGSLVDYDSPNKQYVARYATEYTGRVLATIPFNRPVEKLSDPSPVKTVMIRIWDDTRKVATPWVSVPIQRNLTASLLSIYAQRTSDTNVNVIWTGDTDTVSSSISIYQPSGSEIGSLTGQAASGSANVTISGVNDILPMVARVTPIASGAVDGSPSEYPVTGKADSVHVEYSAPDTGSGYSWHVPPFVGTDQYMRQRIGTSGAWSDPIRIVGETGVGGPYTSVVFARGNSAPALTVTDASNPPTGWSDDPASAPGTGVMWFSRAKVDSTETVITNWSAPIQIEGDQGVQGIQGIQGIQGEVGPQGTSIDYRGAFASAPTSPQLNWVYKNTVDGILYIYDGSSWQVMTYDGNDGAAGAPGINGESVFITYHANEVDTEPSLPTGSGNTSGWHYAPVAADNWMSQKVAASVGVGTWGNPIRITGFNGSDGTNGTNGQNAIQYYIKTLDGNAIKNSTGTIRLELHKIDGSTDTVVSSGTIKMYTAANTDLGYTTTRTSAQINGKEIITAKDGTGGTPLDSISLVDLTDGYDGLYGWVEASNGIAYSRAADAGAWSPNTSPTRLDFTFYQGGSAVARKAVQLSLNSSTGVLTMSTATHGAGDLNASRVTISATNDGTRAVTVNGVYSFGVFASTVSETAHSVINGNTGAQGIPGNPGDNGLPGADGSYMELVYRRASSAPATPNGNGIPASWFNTPPAVTAGTQLYMSTAKKNLDGTLFSGASWSAPVVVSSNDGPVIESYSLAWANLDATGQRLELDYQVANGGTSIQWVVEDNDDLTQPVGVGTSIGFANGIDKQLVTGIHLGQVKTVWLRAAIGTVYGDWVREVVQNNATVETSDPILLPATDTSTNKRNVKFGFKSNVKGNVKIEYIVDESPDNPSTAGTVIGPAGTDQTLTIENALMSSYVRSTDTITRRYLHIRLKGNDDDLFTIGWKTFELPVLNAVTVATSSEKVLVSGSTYYDKVWVDMDVLISGVTVYCDRTAGGTRLLLTSVDTIHDVIDNTKPYRYEFLTKNYTDGSGTESATYTIKVYDASYNVIWSGTQVESGT